MNSIWQKLPEVLANKIIEYNYDLVYTNLYKNVMIQLNFYFQEFNHQPSVNLFGIYNYQSSVKQSYFPSYALKKCLSKKHVKSVKILYLHQEHSYNSGRIEYLKQFSRQEKKIENKSHPPFICIKQQPLTMNHLIMVNILENGVNFDEFNARINANRFHNKYETMYLKKNQNKFNSNTSKRSKKNYNNKPASMRHVRKLRW